MDGKQGGFCRIRLDSCLLPELRQWAGRPYKTFHALRINTKPSFEFTAMTIREANCMQKDNSFLRSLQLPYSTKKFRISIGDNNDQITVPQSATYGYDYMKLLDSANKGNLVLTITYIKQKTSRSNGLVCILKSADTLDDHNEKTARISRRFFKEKDLESLQ